VGIQKELKDKDMRRGMNTSIDTVTQASLKFLSGFKFRKKEKKEHKKMGTKIKRSHKTYI